MNGRRTIERRTRIFVGCEGESEQGYGVFLQRLADEHGLHVHVVAVNLQPGGDPLVLSEKAVKVCAKEEKKGGFTGKGILLDADRLEELPDRGVSTIGVLRREGFTAIWQRPDHEGLLLRHFSGHERDDPPRGRSLEALQAVWPGYHKNMSAIELKRKLSITDVRRAAGVTPDLHILLTLIGLS